MLVQKKTSPTWSALQVSGGAQVLTGADKDLLLSNALIALKESWLGRLQWDVIPVFVCCFFFFCDQRVSIIFGWQLTADMILVLVCRYGWKIQLLFWSIYSFYFVYRLWFIIFASCKDLWQAGAPLSGRKTHPPWISVDFLDSMIFLPTIVVGNQHFATVGGTNMNYEKARFTWYPIWHLSRYAIIICCAIRRLNRKGNPFGILWALEFHPKIVARR